MERVLADLVDLLALERLDRDLFRGRSQDLGWGAIFGGQVLGQALSAAAQTVGSDRAVHSLHGYFVRAGDVTRPILYQVDRLRDGKSFTTRRVVAVQEGEAIFSLEASFQVQETGFDHQAAMPEVPAPDALRSEREMALAVAHELPEPVRAVATAERPIEIRPVEPRDPLHPRVTAPQRHLWYRTIDALPDDPALHRYLLAYASDFSFLGHRHGPARGELAGPGHPGGVARPRDVVPPSLPHG